MAELVRFTEAADTSTSVATVTASASVGDRLVVVVQNLEAANTLASVSDSAGNTYTIHQTQAVDVGNIWIASAEATTGLSSGSSTITATWNGTNYANRSIVAWNHVATPLFDTSAKGGSGWGTAVSASASTTATVTKLFGVVYVSTNSITYGSSAWSVSGSVLDIGATGRKMYLVYYEASAAGTQDPGGTLSGNDTWGAVWVAGYAAAPTSRPYLIRR